MKASRVLGLVGGIISILIASSLLVFGAFVTSWNERFDIAPPDQTLMGLSAVSIIGGMVGIVGGALGRKIGGILMIAGGVIVLVTISYFGIPGMVIMVIGGVLALREARQEKLKTSQ